MRSACHEAANRGGDAHVPVRDRGIPRGAHLARATLHQLEPLQHCTHTSRIASRSSGFYVRDSRCAQPACA